MGGIVTEEKQPYNDPAAASNAEIEEAINNLSDAEWRKLKNYASLKALKKGRKAIEADGEDLLSEAITRTLEGERVWKKDKTDFMFHLTTSMDSISSHYKEGAYLECEFSFKNDEGNLRNTISEMSSPNEMSVDDSNFYNQVIEWIEKALSTNEKDLEVFYSLHYGQTGKEIQQSLGMSDKEFNTSRKRIERLLKKIREMIKNA